MKKILYSILFATILFACKPKQHGAFTVSGVITNATTDKIILEEIPFGEKQSKVIDTGTLKNGKFELRGMAKEEGLYLLSLQNGPQVLLVNDAKSIRVQMDVNNFKKYITEGSKASTQLHELFDNYGNQVEKVKETFKPIDSTQPKKLWDSLLNIQALQRKTEIEKLNKLVVQFLETSESPAASLYAIDMAKQSMQSNDFSALVNKTAEKFKDYENFVKYKKMIEAEQKQLNQGVEQYPLLNKPAPDFSLQTPDNKTFKLSSLKGKYVLVDFWASWCKPCRLENPNVVAAFKKYQNKNFTILGVSLDSNKQDWIDAIAKDNLTWTHVSDLKQWETPMVGMYGFQGIPFNVLIDPSGNIIASNLRGDALDKMLSEILK